MKILQINACHYKRGGAETMYFNTARLLKEHGHCVAFFSSEDNRNEPLGKDEAFFVPYNDIRGLSTFRKITSIPSYLYNRTASNKLEKLLNTFKPDVAHVHLFYGVLSVSILKTLKKYKIPVVHTIHDYRLLCPVKNFIDKNGNICELCRDNKFYHCFKKKCSEDKLSQSAVVMLESYFWKFFLNPIDYIDHFIFVSKFSLDKHSEYNSTFKTKCSQLYNFSNTTFDKNIPTKGDYFFYFGRLSFEKGIKTMLTVFAKKKNRRLVIAGTGPMKDYIEGFAKDNDNIHYVGFKSGKDLEDLILNSLFIIVPSECYENNPMVIIEAYSFGKPVIGTDIGGIPELVKHGENGFLFEYGNQWSLESVIDKAAILENDEYSKLSNTAFNFARQNFNNENYYHRLNKIYNDIFNKINLTKI